MSAQPRVAIYVGPQIRDGFVDVDTGIRDSIKDIKSELRKTGRFEVVEHPNFAKLRLEIVGRRAQASGSGTALPIGTATYYAGGSIFIIDSLLRIGDHQKEFTSDDQGWMVWRHAAQRVAKDVGAWVDANRAMIP